MKKTGSYLSATALGSISAVAALLVGLSGANAQAPAPGAPLSGAGSFPGSFIVPGTNTSLHVGGIIQIDTTYDFNNPGTSPGAQQNDDANNINLTGPTVQGVGGTHNIHGTFRINPNATHPFFETRTPTPYGELKTFWEIDFAGTYSSSGATITTGQVTSGTNCCSNTSTPRLKQAYGTLGPWLIGMTNSNYADLDSLADTLDAFVEAGAFMGAGTAKEPQIRYTYLLPGGLSASASIEEAQSSGLFSSSATGQGAAAIVQWNNYNSPTMSQRIPAVTVKGRIDQPWGHAALAVAVMQERLQNGASAAGLGGVLAAGNPFVPGAGNYVAPGSHFAQFGYQILQSGHFNTIGKDKVSWNLGYGQGAAQYNWALDGALGTQDEEGLVCSSTNPPIPGLGAAFAGGQPYRCSEPRVMGVNVGYSHWWTDEWRSGVSYGWDHVTKPDAAGAWTQVANNTAAAGLNALISQSQSAAVNIQWTPVPAVQFGLEGRWYRELVWSGGHGTRELVDFQTLFKF